MQRAASQVPSFTSEPQSPYTHPPEQPPPPIPATRHLLPAERRIVDSHRSAAFCAIVYVRACERAHVCACVFVRVHEQKYWPAAEHFPESDVLRVVVILVVIVVFVGARLHLLGRQQKRRVLFEPFWPRDDYTSDPCAPCPKCLHTAAQTHAERK